MAVDESLTFNHPGNSITRYNAASHPVSQHRPSRAVSKQQSRSNKANLQKLEKNQLDFVNVHIPRTEVNFFKPGNYFEQISQRNSAEFRAKNSKSSNLLEHQRQPNVDYVREKSVDTKVINIGYSKMSQDTNYNYGAVH